MNVLRTLINSAVTSYIENKINSMFVFKKKLHYRVQFLLKTNMEFGILEPVASQKWLCTCMLSNGRLSQLLTVDETGQLL